MKKLFFVLILGCAACTTQAQDPSSRSGAPVKAAPAPASGLLAQIRTLTADARCSDSSQCRSLPIGSMPCGGPEDYLPYSTARTDEKAVRALAERYKAEVQAQNTRGGMMSICRHLPDPGAVCVSGSCQLGAGAAAR